jgi:hypothetical protein
LVWTVGENSTRRKNSNLPPIDLPVRSTDQSETLGIVGYLVGYPWLEARSPKPTQSREIKSQPSRTPLTLEHRKPQNRAPKLTDLGGESKEKRTTKGSHEFPQLNTKSKVPKTHQENHKERAPKISTMNNREQHNKALRNHAESFIHTKKVHTRSSLPPDHPTLS